MSDWIPEVSVISPERQVILDLIALCKKEMAHRRSVILASQILANTGHSALANQFADQIKAALEATVPTDEDVLFRPVESALLRGEAYLPLLRSLLSKHQ